MPAPAEIKLSYRIKRTYRTRNGAERVYHYDMPLAVTRLTKAVKAGVTFRPTGRCGFWESECGMRFRSGAVAQLMRKRVGYYDGKVLRRMG